MEKAPFAELGPLAGLVGTWEGQSGEDLAPSASRGVATSAYRERTTFLSVGAVDNHEQHLFGLRYHTVAWRVGGENPFHEDQGYWLWDPAAEQVLKAFTVPRGIAGLAGGAARAADRVFTVRCALGSNTFGLVSSPFLDREFQTVRFELTMNLQEDGVLSYTQDTVLRLAGREELFHHTDRNVLRKLP